MLSQVFLKPRWPRYGAFAVLMLELEEAVDSLQLGWLVNGKLT